MIKKIITSKITATATSETVVIGLKLIDAEAHFLKIFGIGLALVSASILLLCWANHTESAAPVAALVPVASTKRTRKNSRRSRASHSN